MSVLDVERSADFYQRAFGYRRTGGYDRLFDGRVTDKVLAVRNVRHRLRWLNDDDPTFQLELIAFRNPPFHHMPPERRPCDHGFQRLALWVADFDATLARLQALGVALLTPPRDYGGGRRVCCRDPDGVVLELLERDIDVESGAPARGPRGPVRTRAVTISVPSLPAAERFYRDLLGMERAQIALHTPEMEELWGLPGARARSALFWAGHHLVELVEYLSPVPRARAAEASVGDAGIFHVALRFPRGQAVSRTHRAVTAAGYRSNSDPVNLLLARLVYLRSPEGDTVECLYHHPAIGRFIGYPGRPDAR
jgi:catechol 2,3-dioxygenase-like lactoylglutathione lyase family enzyme